MEYNKAIVVSGCRKLVGSVCVLKDKPLPIPGDSVKMQNVFEFRHDVTLLPNPHAPGGIAAVQSKGVLPLDCEEKGVDIAVKIDNIRWFDDMDDKGRKYEEMIADCEQALVYERAAKSNIVPARNMPTQDQNTGKLIL